MRVRIAPLLAGLALLVGYLRIGAEVGYHAAYGPALAYDPHAQHGFLYIGTTEYAFWIAQLALVVPGALLIGWGLEPRLTPALVRLARAIDTASTRQWRWAALALFVGLTLVYAVGHFVVLSNRPITDDENAVTFGARMLAEGHLRVPVLQPAGAFTDMFTYQRDGMVCAMDFAGVILFAAAGIATKLGGVLYAIASAASAVAVGSAAKRWLGPRGAVLAVAIWIASPMALSLSLTTHGHVPSRLFIALAVALAARLDTGAATPRRDALLLGLCAGLAFLCRPFEAVFLLLPLGAWLIVRAPSRVLGIAAGLVWPLVVFAWFNERITGIWYLQARFGPGIVNAQASRRFGVIDRLGFNLGFNLAMLAIFFLGIPALVAIVRGLDRTQPIRFVLFACVLGQLALCLLHDNVGIHAVGPIHLSELVVPLSILAAAGGLRILAGRPRAASLVACYLVVACGIFSVTSIASLQTTTAQQAEPERLIAEVGIHHAIVLCEPYVIWAMANSPTGTWVLAFPAPDPFFRDDVIFAKHTADRAALRKAFPDRKLYTMTYWSVEPSLRLTELPDS